VNLDHRYLVVGRAPPEGRDLDVLARHADAVELAHRLRDEGFVERGGRWARFRHGDVEVVDVVDVDAWGLPVAEGDALFASAVVGRPSPAHAVLLEARRWTAGGVLTPRRRARIEEALAHGEGVWDDVARRAPAWGVEEALPVVHGASPQREAVRRVRRRLARPRGAVVAFSGIDGSGKSSQVEALQRALDRLGYPADTAWTRITINPSLAVVAAPVKWLVTRAGRHRPVPPASATEGRPAGHGAAPTDPARAFRVRHPLVNHAWLLVVAVVNGLAQWRAAAPRLARGRVVVCDRYTLDSAVHLRYKYGPEQRWRVQAGVIRLLSPRPVRSYLLDVPGAVAHARKPEKYTPEQLEHLAQLYREECDRLGVRRMDGQRPPDELAAEIGDEVLQALLTQRGRRRRRTS
jgi:thymidylate kinase